LDYCPMYWAGSAESTDELNRDSPVLNALDEERFDG
jgi:hypothetical protein